jgi:hypothetical protein
MTRFFTYLRTTSLNKEIQCKSEQAMKESWSRLSEQNLRVDKWSVCRV